MFLSFMWKLERYITVHFASVFLLLILVICTIFQKGDTSSWIKVSLVIYVLHCLGTKTRRFFFCFPNLLIISLIMPLLPFVDHSWMTTYESKPKQPSRCGDQSCEAWDEGACSFSTPFMSRNQDISVGNGSPITSDDTQSPAFTCRSSFSSFLVEPSTPCLASDGFSFHGSGDSIGIGTEICSPIPSMPSFAFFSPGSVVKKASCAVDDSANISRVEAIHEGILNT